MKNLSHSMYWTICLLFLGSSLAMSGGFQLNEQGARATGMGGAFVARASDPSAIYYNPAGLSSQQGLNTLVGINLVVPSVTYTGVDSMSAVETSSESRILTPVNIFGSYQLNDDIVIGLGIYNPFVSGIKWPLEWGQLKSGQWLGINKAKRFDFFTWFITPTIAYKINDELSVGLGLSYVSATMKLETETMIIDASGKGFNANIGVIYKPMNGLSVGASYRIKTEIDFSGDVTYGTGLQQAPTLYPGGTVKATIPLPAILSVGASYEITPDLSVEGDFQFIQWSSYKELKIEVTPTIVNGQRTIVQEKRWENSIALRGGCDYSLDQHITLRGGIIMDLTPQPPSKTEPMLPDADQFDVTVGGSFKFNENFSIDLAYMAAFFNERNAKYANSTGSFNPNESGVPGTYTKTVHTVSVNFGYKF